MKSRIFGVLQRVGRSFMLPIAILPVAGLLLGIGSSFTNQTTMATYGLEKLLGEGTVIHNILLVMAQVGDVVFANLPLIFAVGVAIGMAKKEKEVAALAAVIAYFVMNISINAMLEITGSILPDQTISPDVLTGTITSMCGILTLQTGVFGGIIVGLGVAALHNRFYKIQFPNALSFFGGTRFVPIISTLVYMVVGIVLTFVWPIIQNGIYALGNLVTQSGYVGTLIFGIIKRALIPFGLHHVFYTPFWQTAVGGTMEVAGKMVSGGQNIFFAQLADSANITHFSADATRYFSGEFIFMIFGLPGAALAMYRQAKPEKRKAAGGLLLSASLASMLTGITEPIEFSFLFVAPALFVVQVILAGFAYMIAHMLNIAVGLTFSGGLLDLILFGVLQGNDKTSWMLIIPVGILYFFLYYFIFSFLIKKYDFKTPGREDGGEDTKLYSKADYLSKKSDNNNVSKVIVKGLGGSDNIVDIDCCATRLRCTLKDSGKVDEALLRETKASGVIVGGDGVQVIYGPGVSAIKSNLLDYLSGNEDGDIEKSTESITIYSPVTGVADSITAAPDEAFAGKMMGDGAVIVPKSPVITAPADGVIDMVFDTKHAIGITTDSNLKLLIHVGIDTVKLNGHGFEVLVVEGQRVKKGEVLMKLNLEYIRENAKSDATPVVCTELSDNESVRMLRRGNILVGEPLFVVEKKES